MDYIIGIDLGTTNSLVCIWRNNNYEIIKDLNNNIMIPSIVSYTKLSRYIGSDAKNMIELCPETTIYEIKRLIGRKYDDEVVQNLIPYLTYNIVNQDNNIKIEINNNLISPEEISSIILKELKNLAESYLKCSINKAVITVPAYFNDSQRQATKDAAKIAGLECVRIINEPTAAALAYGLQEKSVNKDINVIVYDLGGGTLDVSLLNINDGLFQVLASTGNSNLGGSDFDNRLLNYCLKEFKILNNLTNLQNLTSLSIQKLRKGVENGKKTLAFMDKINIFIPDFYNNLDLNINITIDEFELICRDLFIMALKPLEDVLDSAEMNISDIDDIILVGGATRMKPIQKNIELFFNKKPNITINPDTVVAIGASIQGFIINNNESPFSKNITLLDIIPLSLGIETLNGIMNVIIPRNSIIPIKKERKFTTDTDFMTSVEIKIYEGERSLTKDNNLLGIFTLENIVKDYKGIPVINVEFEIDINGIINVTAQDLNNKNSANITIKNNKSRLSLEDINKIIEDSKIYEQIDNSNRIKRELINKINCYCDIIILNLINTSSNNKDELLEDINKIKDYINKLLNSIQHNIEELNNINQDELKNIKKDIKKKFGILIFKENNNIKSYSSNENGESILNTNNNIKIQNIKNNDSNNYNDNLDDINININKDDNEEKEYLINNLINICTNKLDKINSCLNNEANLKIKDIIDDILLWIYIKENITIDEIKDKTNIVNNLYENEKNNANNDNILIINKDNLENVCYSILNIIKSNDYSKHEELVNELESLLNEILEYICKLNIKINTDDKYINDNMMYLLDDIKRYEDLINEKCNNLYNNLMNSN